MRDREGLFSRRLIMGILRYLRPEAVTYCSAVLKATPFRTVYG